MQPDYNEKIQSVFADVLEHMAFMFADPADEPTLPEQSSGTIAAGIQFSGEMAGEIRLVSTTALAAELASNLLGTDLDDVDDHQLIEAMKELLNVTCGQVLTQIAGSDPVFDLTPPQVFEFNPEEWNSNDVTGSTSFLMVDDEPVVIRFDLNQAA